jgi:hypothetical protein
MQGKKKGRILLNLKPCPYLTFVLIFVSFTKVEGKVFLIFFQKNKKNTISHKNAISWKIIPLGGGHSQK